MLYRRYLKDRKKERKVRKKVQVMMPNQRRTDEAKMKSEEKNLFWNQEDRKQCKKTTTI